jgi:NADPH-dependent 2,4-dienoyl-CoA reductase/sulfur reductase-like enzyme
VQTKLSKALLTEKNKLQWRDDEHYKKAGVDFHLETEVESVDFGGHTLKTKDGKEWKYTKVIFATGGTPRRLPMEGFKTLGNVFVLRGIDDAERILGATGPDGGKNVVVIGSSFIGMEVGKCLQGKKNNVTIVGMESTPLERIMGNKVGAIFKRQLENAGVKFRLSASVDDAKPSESDPSKVGSVALKSGESLPADLVVLGVGVAPATEYFKSSGVELNKDGSVSVDDHWRIKGVEDAYAVGDIATYPYAYGDGPVRIGNPFPFPAHPNLF